MGTHFGPIDDILGYQVEGSPSKNSIHQEKPKLYKIYFRIDVYCCGVISYAEGHTSVLAESEDEAKKKVRENIKLTYSGPTKIHLALDFNRPSNQ